MLNETLFEENFIWRRLLELCIATVCNAYISWKAICISHKYKEIDACPGSYNICSDMKDLFEMQER